jgi:hypothetical protein
MEIAEQRVLRAMLLRRGALEIALEAFAGKDTFEGYLNLLLPGCNYLQEGADFSKNQIHYRWQEGEIARCSEENSNRVKTKKCAEVVQI